MQEQSSQAPKPEDEAEMPPVLVELLVKSLEAQAEAEARRLKPLPHDPLDYENDNWLPPIPDKF